VTVSVQGTSERAPSTSSESGSSEVVRKGEPRTVPRSLLKRGLSKGTERVVLMLMAGLGRRKTFLVGSRDDCGLEGVYDGPRGEENMAGVKKQTSQP
jgi:hypothetical protein